MDGWTPADWALLSQLAFSWIAALLNAIETRGKWPAATRHAKAVFLEKDPEAVQTPLSVRILLMLAYLYRVWASITLARLNGWIKLWATPEIFAGVPGLGASDAWYCTSIEIEYQRCCGRHLTGGAADILKCFDQIVPSLALALLRKAGMPALVLRTYAEFLTNLVIYNALVGGLGKPRTLHCGIPQGCPLSMMIIAIMMLAWVNLMRAKGLHPRVLADDIMLLAFGEDHLRRFQSGFNATLGYIADMGGKVAASKSYVFSTHTTARAFLKQHNWPIINAAVKVVSHIRDLGAHLNLSAKAQGPTQTKRVVQGGHHLRQGYRWITHVPRQESHSSSYQSLRHGPVSH